MSEEYKKIDSTCGGTATKRARVCLPISVKPYAEAGTPIVTTSGDPVIRRCCRGEIDATCDFTITQTIEIEIPVEYGASMSVGDTYVCCGGTDAEDSDDYSHDHCCDDDRNDTECNEERLGFSLTNKDSDEDDELHNSLKDDLKSIFKGKK